MEHLAVDGRLVEISIVKTCDEHPTVSIVIPTHNRCDLLKQTIASISAQSFDCWELIIVDDASDDDTWSWLLQLKDPRIRNIHLKQHQERARTRNVGLELARGRFILFLDDDDLLPERSLEIHLKALERCDSALGSVGGHRLFGNSGSYRTVRNVRRKSVHNIWTEVLFGWVPVSGQCLFRTKMLRDVDGWRDTFVPCEDHDLLLRLGRLGPFVLVPEVVLLYRVHDHQYRSANQDQIMTTLRNRALADLTGKDRDIGNSILRARAIANEGLQCQREAQNVRAFFLYLRVLQLEPALLRSPLVRNVVFRRIFSCLIGRRGTRAIRSVIGWFHQPRHKVRSFVPKTKNNS